MTSNAPALMQALGQLAPAPSSLGNSSVPVDAIMAGIGPSFSILTYRGKVWRVKYRGEEAPIMMRPEQPGMPSPGPAPYVDLVIVHSSPAISKIFYEELYQEGSTESPDCFSSNGVVPDQAAPRKQSELCATCPKNAWGSRANVADRKSVV